MPESHASRGARRGRRLLADLGDEIRAARKASGVSQAAVATAAGLSSSEVSRIEHGDSPWLDLVTASRLCAVVGLTCPCAPSLDPSRYGTLPMCA